MSKKLFIAITLIVLLVLQLTNAGVVFAVKVKEAQHAKQAEKHTREQTERDKEDNQHSSRKNHSIEPGKSDTQGKSPSDPDGNTNNGKDKPGFNGGFDKGDQDGNNGCGNDDDFEDDNNGNCSIANKTKYTANNPKKEDGTSKPDTKANNSKGKESKSNSRKGKTHCADGEIKSIEAGAGKEVSYTLDTSDSSIITGVCIKSGSNMFGGDHSDVLTNGTYENGCYTVTGVGTKTVTVRKNFESNLCQDISHIDVVTGFAASTVTPTPISATPTETPTPTPIKATSSIAIGPTVTPTPAVAAVSEMKKGVLSATTLPRTGNFLHLLSQLFLSASAVALGTELYKRIKDNRIYNNTVFRYEN